MRTLRSGRSLASLFTGLAALGALLVAAPSAHAVDTPLRDLATAKGKIIGTAVTGSKLTGTYGDIAGREFNSLTPGNAMKWESVEPSRGTYNWAEADRIVDFAEAHDQQVRGHTLGIASQWSTGFTGQVRIACSGASLSSWKVNWMYGAGQRITQAWNATCTQSGTEVSCSHASYNGAVPDGGSVTFGFNGTWNGSNTVPVVTLG
ncbi:cellulose binding domain-containing protein [Streptomyces sp. KR55]|uniref:cellulose binding domain-containing protein n=1 Tax=Streptomyces sp. KR55 TaxID=3457425 RepID=UPI003FD2F48A